MKESGGRLQQIRGAGCRKSGLILRVSREGYQITLIVLIAF